MGGRTIFSKRMRRYIGAGMAAAVTTFIGLSFHLEARAQACGLRDATLWQLALHDPEIEQSPAYIRQLTETFISACPDRPELAEAHRIAGIAASDMDDVVAAAQHFEAAGFVTDLTSNFYAIAAFFGSGDAASAWRTRDRMVEMWRTKLERHPRVSITAEPHADGMIYQVYFSETDHESGTRAAWVAVPFGAGLPATLSFSHDRQRLALRKAKAARDFEFRYVDLHRCHGRRVLGRIDKDLASHEFDAAAQAALTAYLANPDQPASSADDPIQVCTFPSRLLPGVPKTQG